jgi:ribose-phosphate pyrophosphokinase
MEQAIKLFAGTASIDLARTISKYVDIPVSKSSIRQFADGELKVKIEENIRGCDVFIVQSTYPPAEHIMELLLFLDAARRASAARVTAVIPYFGYARQDRKDEPRVPISAKLIANLLATSGANRVLTMELHAEQIQGFFDIPVDHLYAVPIFVDYYHKRDLKDYVIISPDLGRANRVRGFARRLSPDLPVAIVEKRRTGPNQSSIVNVIGDVTDKTALIYDDMLDTGGTMVDAAQAIMDKGAKRVYACVVHPLLSGEASEKVKRSCIEELVVTDTLPLSNTKMFDKIKILSVAQLLGKGIVCIHRAESISSLFKEVEE